MKKSFAYDLSFIFVIGPTAVCHAIEILIHNVRYTYSVPITNNSTQRTYFSVFVIFGFSTTEMVIKFLYAVRVVYPSREHAYRFNCLRSCPCFQINIFGYPC